MRWNLKRLRGFRHCKNRNRFLFTTVTPVQLTTFLSLKYPQRFLYFEALWNQPLWSQPRTILIGTKYSVRIYIRLYLRLFKSWKVCRTYMSYFPYFSPNTLNTYHKPNSPSIKSTVSFTISPDWLWIQLGTQKI